MQAEQRLKEIFLKVFDNLKSEEFDINKRQADYENWDSFTHMQLISEVEGQFNVSLTVDEVTQIQSPKDILDIIAAKGKNEGA